MQAVILAAGMGKRLKELTASNTKCMVKVNGETLISRVLHQLDALELTRVIIVIGYEGKKLQQYISTITDIKVKVEYIDNPIYNKTNNIYSLSLAKNCLLEEDTLLVESDLIFEEGILKSLAEDNRPNLALVDKFESWMDGTVVKLDEEDTIKEFISGKNFRFEEQEECYKTVNAYKFSKEFSRSHYVPFLDAYMTALGNNEYYEQVLRVIALLDEPVIQGKRLNGQKWYEIDDVQDLDVAESIFTRDDKQHLSKVSGRFGGYWRYPKLLDFCYLVNPYFPPARMKQEMSANFDVLLTTYPSGMKVNSIIAARNFEVHEENIIVGNGAAELIKTIIEDEKGNIGFVRPTFEEYPNRCEEERKYIYIPDNENFSYTEENLMEYFEDKNIQMLVVVNPDNPTGNFIQKESLFKLIKWTDKKGIRFIIDESFVDFSDRGEDNSVIEQKILDEYKHLIVVKSISKSYGVPGIRLGIAAGGDKNYIAEMKKKVAIWNINSFGEFFMQIYGKYEKDYKLALKKFYTARKRFVLNLEKIDDLRVIPTQANYIMCEVLNGKKSQELAAKLLNKCNILIKDLSAKMGNDKQYVRLAIRNEADNDILIQALNQIIHEI